MSFSIQIRKIKFPVSILSTIYQHSYACIHMSTRTHRQIHILIYLYVYMYMHFIIYVCLQICILYLCIYTHNYMCVQSEPVKDGSIFAWPHPSEKKTIELWASFSEMYLYFVSCDGTGQSPTSHTAFVVGIPHPVTVKSCQRGHKIHAASDSTAVSRQLESQSIANKWPFHLWYNEPCLSLLFPQRCRH